MNRAVFLDRDGVIVQLVYSSDTDTVDTVSDINNIELVPGIIEFLKNTASLGYQNIIISNQPQVGLNKISEEKFYNISEKIINIIKSHNASIHDQFYCFHHPYAKLKNFKIRCRCRKPNIGMFRKAAKKYNIDLSSSWMIGDGIKDMQAGMKAGCKTILITNIDETAYLHMFEKRLKGVKPTYIVKNLRDATEVIKQ